MGELYGLPEGWEWKKLGNIVKLQNGFAFKSKLFTNDGLPIVRIKNIKNEKVTLDDVVYFNPKDYSKNLDTYQIKKNDLLIAMSGATTGKIGLYDRKEESYLNQRVGLFRIENFDLRSYLFYFLSTQIEKNLARSLGAAQPNLSTQQINDMSIPLPPLQEQKRIVAKLDSLFAKIDQAITLHQQNMDEADALMGSVLNEVFGELEGKYGMDILSNSVDDPKKNIVDGPFGSNLKASEYIESGIPIIRLQNIQRFSFIDKDIKYVSEEKAKKLKRHSFVNGDIVITKLGDPLGKACIVPDFLKSGIIVADVIRVRPSIEKALVSFIVYAVNSQLAIEQFSDSSKGATRQRVKLTMVRDLKVPIPPITIQQKTITYLDKLSQKTKKLKQAQQEKMQSLKDLKASLLDRAFRGEI